MAATATISHRLNPNYAFAVKHPVVTSFHGLGQALSTVSHQNHAALPLHRLLHGRNSPCNYKNSLPCFQHLSSAEHCMKKLNGGFCPAHHVDASAEVHCSNG
jgi:hypothetical protein